MKPIVNYCFDAKLNEAAALTLCEWTCVLGMNVHVDMDVSERMNDVSATRAREREYVDECVEFVYTVGVRIVEHQKR